MAESKLWIDARCYVRHMALVILLVLTGLLFVAEDDLADGHCGERGAPRAVRRVVPRRVLASVARDVAEVVGLPARLEDEFTCYFTVSGGNGSE